MPKRGGARQSRGQSALAFLRRGPGGRSRAGMALIPAGLYTPFQRVRPIKAVRAVETPVAIGAFRLDVEPVTNAEFLDFVAAPPSGASRGSSRCSPTPAI